MRRDQAAVDRGGGSGGTADRRRVRASGDGAGRETVGTGRTTVGDAVRTTRIAGDAGASPGSRPAQGADTRQSPLPSPSGRQRQRDAHIVQAAPAAGAANAAASGAAVSSSIHRAVTRRTREEIGTGR